MLKRRYRELKRSRTPGVFTIAQVNHEKTERNLLRHFESALDFVHGIDAPALLRMDDVHAGGAAASHFEIGVEWRVQRECFRWIRPEPLGEIANFGAVGVVEMPTRGKKLDPLGSGFPKCVKQARMQAVAKKYVRRDNLQHEMRPGRTPLFLS